MAVVSLVSREESQKLSGSQLHKKYLLHMHVVILRLKNGLPVAGPAVFPFSCRPFTTNTITAADTNSFADRHTGHGATGGQNSDEQVYVLGG